MSGDVTVDPVPATVLPMLHSSARTPPRCTLRPICDLGECTPGDIPVVLARKAGGPGGRGLGGGARARCAVRRELLSMASRRLAA